MLLATCLASAFEDIWEVLHDERGYELYAGRFIRVTVNKLEDKQQACSLYPSP